MAAGGDGTVTWLLKTLNDLGLDPLPAVRLGDILCVPPCPLVLNVMPVLFLPNLHAFLVWIPFQQ